MSPKGCSLVRDVVKLAAGQLPADPGEATGKAVNEAHASAQIWLDIPTAGGPVRSMPGRVVPLRRGPAERRFSGELTGRAGGHGGDAALHSQIGINVLPTAVFRCQVSGLRDDDEDK